MPHTIGNMPERDSYRTVVVGAGPAGVLAALRAASAGPVLLVDASPLPRHKSCGGMIHALSERVLARHGLRIGPAIREPERVRFRFLDWDAGVTKSCSLAFHNVDRDEFDLLLLDALPPSVEVVAPCPAIAVQQDGDGCTVSLEAQGRRVEVRCALVIGADGARSAVREAIAGRAKPYVTLQDTVDLHGPLEPFFDCIYSSRIGAGHAYSYLVPKDGHALVGSVFYPGTRRPREQHESVLAELRARMRAIGESVAREASAAAFVRGPQDVVAGAGRVLLAGEAGGFLSPTSGEGISYALRTGEAAGLAATRDPDEALDAYRRDLRPLVRQIRFKLAVLPAMESPTGRALARALPAPVVSAVTRYL